MSIGKRTETTTTETRVHVSITIDELRALVGAPNHATFDDDHDGHGGTVDFYWIARVSEEAGDVDERPPSTSALNDLIRRAESRGLIDPR